MNDPSLPCYVVLPLSLFFVGLVPTHYVSPLLLFDCRCVVQPFSSVKIPPSPPSLPPLPPTTISLAWSCLTALALERRRRASKPRSLCTTQFCEFSTHANEHCLGNTPSTTPHLVCQSTALLLCWCGGANVCCSLFDLLLLLSVTLCVQI